MTVVCGADPEGRVDLTFLTVVVHSLRSPALFLDVAGSCRFFCKKIL